MNEDELIKSATNHLYRFELVSGDGERLFAIGPTPESLSRARSVIGGGCVILPRKKLSAR